MDLQVILRYFDKASLDILQSALTSAGIVGAFYLYFKRRQRFPSALVTHQHLHKFLPDGTIFLRVTATIANKGQLLIRITDGMIRIQELVPWDQKAVQGITHKEGSIIKGGDTEGAWPLLYEREFDGNPFFVELEPGEIDECNFDFILNSTVESVVVYTYFKNKYKHPVLRRLLSVFKKSFGKVIGWNTTSVYDLVRPDMQKEANTICQAKQMETEVMETTRRRRPRKVAGEETRKDGPKNALP